MSIASLARLFNKTGTAGTYNEVATFAELPPAADNMGVLYYVTTQTGVIFINRKLRGWYRSDGINWLYGGDLDISADEVSYDNSTSGLTATDVQVALDEIAATIGAGINYADAETPLGTIDGLNAVFNLANTPNPADSLDLEVNGLGQTDTIDYNLSGSTITFVASAIPETSSILRASYRY